MDDLKTWLNDTFYTEVTETKTYTGYQTERISNGNYQYTAFELPFDVTVTTTHHVIAWDSVASFVLIVFTFITVTTFLRKAVFGR